MQWKTSKKPIAYPTAIKAMEQRVQEIAEGKAPELVWFLEHPPLYTSGTSAKKSDLLEARFPVYEAGRGGQFTYHGPGQRVAYVMLNLKKRTHGQPDLRGFVKDLERWIIATLRHFDVEGFTREGRIGVWVNQMSDIRDQTLEKDNLTSNIRHLTSDFGEAKIAALGIRVKKGISYHGISINVHPDLSHYAGIVPCGLHGYGVTSLAALGVDASLAAVDKALKAEFSGIFSS